MGDRVAVAGDPEPGGLIAFWVKLLQLYFAGEEHYFRFQCHQAERLFRDIRVRLPVGNDADAYDFGCGNGGYSLVMAKHFSSVLAVDFFNSAELGKFDGVSNVSFQAADLRTYRGAPRQFLFCASVLEHIPKAGQHDFVANLRCNISDGGYLYLSFPPFLSLNGGHLAAPFHYLPEQAALWLSRKLRKHEARSYATMFGDWGLYPTSIGEVEGMLHANGFEILRLGCRFMPAWYERLFARNNFMNWHAEFLCRKT